MGCYMMIGEDFQYLWFVICFCNCWVIWSSESPAYKLFISVQLFVLNSVWEWLNTRTTCSDRLHNLQITAGVELNLSNLIWLWRRKTFPSEVLANINCVVILLYILNKITMVAKIGWLAQLLLRGETADVTRSSWIFTLYACR